MTNQDFKDIMKTIVQSLKQTMEFSPVGEIISYMGNTAPEHYLVCDGTEYTIGDYPLLEQHFIDQFGSVNYFGGDGEITFKVPDLRGEFLRGTGTATRGTGSGANVGVHQSATKTVWMCVDGNHNVATPYNPAYPVNYDLSYTDTGITWCYPEDKTSGITRPNQLSLYTTRPTNTSVLYCIKYEFPSFSIEDIIGGGYLI